MATRLRVDMRVYPMREPRHSAGGELRLGAGPDYIQWLFTAHDTGSGQADGVGRAADLHRNYKSVVRRRYHTISQACRSLGIGFQQLVDQAGGAVSLNGHDGRCL